MNSAPRTLPTIAEAHPAASPAMIASLARAFADDPAMTWIMPDPADRHARLPRLFAALVKEEFSAGWALSSPGSEAVTLWRSSAAVHGSLWQLVQSLPRYMGALGGNLLRGLAVSESIEKHHPQGLAYDYLHYAGVDPAFQGRGWGGAAIRAGQARAAANGRPIYLETATPENVGLYQRMGFSLREEWDAPRGGPHFWSMWWEGP
ncbi:MAG: GNAT family N-acetyltransferase [Novosphingobium sp.]|uniref:GNAT family N-acetyltransferase n=1 Tax=Novosphingobium sp. TaxID=1874826 RepID=UPI0032BB1882